MSSVPSVTRNPKPPAVLQFCAAVMSAGCHHAEEADDFSGAKTRLRREPNLRTVSEHQSSN
ncbi:hypothetical protein NFI96_025025 [Prochilodus magdalenae]|nr:hypothetical protein NFI96_025025 [Prochilodus magdalenae]